MNPSNQQLLFALLRSAICDTVLTQEEKEALTDEVWAEIYVVAKKHDIAHLLAVAIRKNTLWVEGNVQKSIENEYSKAIFRYEQLNYELEEICKTFETAQISFIPLKGSVIRSFYPEPWMRTSCDIDILVHKEDIERAISVLVENCAYTYKSKSSHDVSLYTVGGNHIELHYDLIEDGRINAVSEVLATVWDRTVLNSQQTYRHEMADEMFYFYHIAHMAKHFEIGGCGIRPFIDLWLLDNGTDGNTQRRKELLERGGLLKFAQVAQELSRVWFACVDYKETTQKMERYIVQGGVYGSDENRISVQQQRKGGKFKYAMSRIFLPYKVIKYQYPKMGKHRILTPLMNVCRWFRLAFGSRRKNVIHELGYNQSLSKQEAKETKEFLNQLGL